MTNPPTTQIRLQCTGPVDPITNEIQALMNAVTSTPNCNGLELETDLSTTSGFAPAGTEVMLSTADINIVGFHTYAIDEVNGTIAEVTFGATTYEVPLLNAPANQIRLKCDQSAGLPNQMQELLNAIAATQNCNGLELEADLQTVGGLATAGTMVTL